MAAVHKHPVYDTDLHLIINPITRSVKNESGKTVIMQNDHDSERFTFEIPRYVEGHDMRLCNVVQVHYINIDSSNKSNQNADIYPVVDLQLSPESEDIVIGSWLISKNATLYAGSLNFIFRFACVDEETSEITYQWFSDVSNDLKVSKGIYNIEALTGGNNSDILEAWKREVIESAREEAKIITDEIVSMLDEVNKNIADYEERILGSIFTVNFETGELEYTSPDITFIVNENTGNLEWSVAKESENTDTAVAVSQLSLRMDDVENRVTANEQRLSNVAQVEVGENEPNTVNTIWYNTATN